MDQDGSQDSPLSIAANMAGLLTFVFAVAATVYARIRYLQSSSTEYLGVKTSLSWYKTESTWLSHLIRTQETQPTQRASADEDADASSADEKSSADDKSSSAEWPRHRRRAGLDDAVPTAQRVDQQMFAFVMEDLLNLEQRLLDMVSDVESRADPTGGMGVSWSLVPWTWHGSRPSIAVAWLGVRTKALELVRQREALTARVQFLQLGMIASRLHALEGRVAADRQRDSRVL
ncbi:hypothetical protein A9K55_006975 [Cordyceps militaris]|uniref:Uncharacterized protein n=1 Tax=Cordyceps militaris TaxID=73501 RepID=A0A2H4SH49_CORMI|nr:hypothetical protein A9K55_006975 [Cordyceps militaris]